MRTVRVTKKSVTLAQRGLYTVTLNMKCLDGETVLLDQDFTEQYWSGKDPAPATARMMEKMQDAIDIYKAEQTIFNAEPLDDAIAVIQAGLEV